MNVYGTYEISEAILRKSGGSRNPDVICRCLGIEIYEYDLGNLKGMYSSADRHRTIFLNKRLYGYLRRFVLAHEIGHDQIPEHRKMARSMPCKELQFFSESKAVTNNASHSYGWMTSDTEREANSVAAHILIDDDAMMELVREGRTTQSIACELCVPEDLLLIELEDYSKIHPEYQRMIQALPRNSRGNYLKDYTDGTF